MHETTRALNELLRSSGLITQDEAVAALRASGHQIDDESWFDFWYDEDLGPAIDIDAGGGDLLVWLPSLLDGRVFTHRLTAKEIAQHRIEVAPDLTAISTLLDREPYDSIGAAAVYSDVDATAEFLQLPPGSLAGSKEGDPIGIRVTARGLVPERIPTAPPEWSESDIERLVAVFEAEAGEADDDPDPELDDDLEWEAEPVELADLLYRLMLSNPEIWTTPTQPVSELLERADLVVDGGWVRRRGTAGSDEADSRFQLLDVYGLDEYETSAAWLMIMSLDLVDAAIDEWETAGRPADAKPELPLNHLVPLLEALAEPVAGLALVDIGVNGSPHRAMSLVAIINPLMASAPRRARATMHYLRGRCLDLVGRLDESEAELERAVDLASDYWPALRALAANASDRGDARRAVSLLQRSGVSESDNELMMVSRYLPKEHPELGRNSPCWCGSGRKFKMCHGSARSAEPGQTGGSSFTLVERRDWLYYKVARWVQEVAGRALMLGLAEVRSHFAIGPDAVTQALGDPLVLDVALFEGGLLAEFLEVRGSLLPADEQLLAASWLTTPRSLYEVEAVRPEKALVLRDLRTGERHDVPERLGTRQVKVGMLLCVHLLATGTDENGSIFGGIDPVPDHLRDATLEVLDRTEPDPYLTIEVLTRRFLAPDVRTAEGDELRACTATLVVPNPKDLIRWLDREFRAGEDGGWDWTVPADLGERVLASVQRDGGWTVSAMSERRFDEFLERLRSAVPGVTISHQSRLRLDEFTAQHPVRPSTPDPNDEAAVELLAQMILKYEERWLDDSIPALGGSTPRQAADDPTRRGDLIRLLGSFEDMPANPGTMNVGRLRTALGLDVDATP